ncbi:hypothetical protein BDV93DRAFT_223079 [Ceratobasidium sp. AG-I]|nr:hypothetical protein BDV93DRAFT_223079 [Ceratobasidium sp. AG-I]
MYSTISPLSLAVAVSSHTLPEKIHKPRDNPPVDLLNWPDPDSDADSEATVDEEPTDGPDQDPPPCLRSSPINPPTLTLSPSTSPIWRMRRYTRLCDCS